ncbi:MAG: hypothetical protein FJ267_01925 [Planctomycetes bacterium]|nr:hypothetical protein [Planctomycetota bacterium]
MSELQKPTLLPEDVAKMLQEMGYRGRVIDDGAIAKVESATNGSKFFVNFFSPQDDDRSKGFEEIQFDTGFGLRYDVNAAKLVGRCNRFNAEYRFAKLSVWGQKYRYITMKIDFLVTANDFTSFQRCASMFFSLMQSFMEEVIESDDCKGDGCSDLHSDAIQFQFGVNRDPKAAIEAYRIAAERGFAGSQNNLGDLYETAANLPKSDEFAVYWYTRAAERGEPTAYLSLATLLSEKSVDREMLIEAAKFAFLAVGQLPEGFNMKIANDCLASLKNLLTADDLALAEQRAKSWEPLYQEHRLMSDSPQAHDIVEQPSKTIH